MVCRAPANHQSFLERAVVANLHAERAPERTQLALRFSTLVAAPARILKCFREFGEAEGVDVSAGSVVLLPGERGLENVKQGAAEALPYEDNSFDLVTGLDVVEHLDDDLAGLKEMRRVLRRGGRAFCLCRRSCFLWGVQDDISNHRRRYTLKRAKAGGARSGL